MQLGIVYEQQSDYRASATHNLSWGRGNIMITRTRDQRDSQKDLVRVQTSSVTTEKTMA